MPMQANLTERYQNILRATIQHYIATAEPVGSKTLVEEYDFSISSATIRHALGRLEKAGFLYQPHTSAGRIPSDSGYRVYVDQLITPDAQIGQQIGKSFSQQLKRENRGFETLLQRATQILANLSGYIALITMPQAPANQLRHLQLIQVSPKQVMLIMVTEGYQTQSLLMDLPQSVILENSKEAEYLEEELHILSNFLNSKLRGRCLTELMLLDWQEIDQEFVHYADFLRTILKQLSSQLQPSLTPPIMIHGVSEFLRQPEFSHLQQVQMLLHLLEEEQDQLLPLIFAFSDRDVSAKRVTIRIGAENPLEPMRPCTLISAIYRQGSIPVGSVGIIGPTRMIYENAIALVESAADYLSEALS